MPARKQLQLQYLFACLGIIIFINLFSSFAYNSLSLVVNLKMTIGGPAQTRFVIPPVGEVRAATHKIPVSLSLELKNVNLSLLRTIVFTSPQALQPLYAELENSLRQLVLLFIVRLLTLAFLGAVFALLFLGNRNLRTLFWAGIAGVLATIVLISFLYWSYDLAAFRNLEYEGIIEAAPWVLDLASEALNQVESLGERVQVLAGNLYSALERLEQLGPLGLIEADMIVLHVSDIHNNPIAYDFTRQVIESFPVDFVIDTGDLTDWGTALEAEVSSRIEELNLPYVFVAGNHESPDVLRRLKEVENVIIIDRDTKNVMGISIAGSSDLVAHLPLPAPASVAELTQQAKAINEKWSQVAERPDIFLVHNHRVAKAIEPGLFPVVLYGHTHVLEILQIDDTVYNNAGTTGAAGIRGFQAKEPLPYSLSLLYFSWNEGNEPVLIAVDGVHVTGFGLSFSLQRTFVDRSRNLDSDVEMVR